MRNEVKETPWIFTDDNSRVKILPQKLYAYMKEHLKLKITDKGNIFLYEDDVYRCLSQREFKAMIKEYLPVQYRKDKDWEAVWKEFSTDFPDVKESDFDSDETIVGFTNGVLHLNDGTLIEYDDKHLLTRKIPCKYIPNKTLEDAPVFHEYLKTLCQDSKIEMTFLLEYMGAILSNVKGWRFKKLLILVGAGNTGKTQLRELTMNLLGREHCVSIDMKKINERFGAAQLYRKRLSGSGDMSTVEISEMNVMKNLTGGDSLFAEYKGKDGFSFRYDGFLWFNANALPHFRGDRGNHVYSRFAIIQCENVIPTEKRDPQLLDKMMAEKDIIASVAIDAFKNAIERGYRFIESEEMEKTRREYTIENNSLLMFVKDCCTLYSVGDKTKRSDFNAIYKRWCIANRVFSERERDIGKQLEEHFMVDCKKSGGYYFYSLKINDEVRREYDRTNYALEEVGMKYQN